MEDYNPRSGIVFVSLFVCYVCDKRRKLYGLHSTEIMKVLLREAQVWGLRFEKNDEFTRNNVTGKMKRIAVFYCGEMNWRLKKMRPHSTAGTKQLILSYQGHSCYILVLRSKLVVDCTGLVSLDGSRNSTVHASYNVDKKNDQEYDMLEISQIYTTWGIQNIQNKNKKMSTTIHIQWYSI